MGDDSNSQGGFLSMLLPSAAAKPQAAAGPPPPSATAPAAATPFGFDPSVGTANALLGKDGTIQHAIDWLFGHWNGSSDSKPAGAQGPDPKQAADEAARKASEAKYKADEDAKADRDERRKALPAQVREDAEKQRKEDQKLYDNGSIDQLPSKRTDDDLKRREHSKMVAGEYLTTDKIPEKNPQEPVGNLDSKEDRLRYLQGFTQFDKSDPKSESYCAPTALIAATIMDKGTKGLAPMITQMSSSVKPDSPEGKHLAELQKKVADGKMTNEDMAFMQKTLYSQLMDYQQKNKTYDKKDEPGISENTMKNFLQEDSSGYLRGAFIRNNMSMSLMDNNADGKVNHWVLNMRSGNDRSVYDPWSRKNGQIVKSEDQVNDYRNTSRVTYDEAGNISTKQVEAP